MRLKTIREELLFAAHDYHQKAKQSLETYHALFNLKGHKQAARDAKKAFGIYSRRAKAMDEAIRLL